MTGEQGKLFKLGAELFEQPELDFDGAAAAPAAAAPRLVECATCSGRPLVCQRKSKTCAGFEHAANRSHWCPITSGSITNRAEPRPVNP